MSEEKADCEFDGYTWAPKINDSSRRIALATYAAAPDPARPWTTSPRHKTAPPRYGQHRPTTVAALYHREH
jgi:hypothetical protein